MRTSIFQRSALKSFVIASSLSFIVKLSTAQSPPTCPNPYTDPPVNADCGYSSPLKHQRITGLDIAGGMFKGLVQYLPADYNVDPNKKYPVIIYFHGLQGVGQGTTNDLCRIFCDATHALPGRIEMNQFPTTVSHGGQDYSYIVISPQYTVYDYGGHNFPTASHVEAVIDYVVANYKVDINRIYLTGMSSGANAVIEYAASSPARAERVAAIAMASECSRVDTFPNDGLGPARIAAAGLATWFIHCEMDGPLCLDDHPEAWYNQIVAARGNPPTPDPITRYTELTTAPGPMQCYTPFPHDTWGFLYDPNFRINGTNVYEWLIQFSRSFAVPVKLKEFSARLVNGKVHLRWVTTDEVNNSFFTLEKAGSDQQFVILATLPPSNSSAPEKIYEYIDDKPLANISYYRLLQTDRDGRKNYYQARRVLNRTVKNKLLTTPNPFINELSVFISIDKPQKIAAYISDPNGKQVKRITAIYPEGTSEINFKTFDLKAGIYFLKVESQDFTETKKIIKQ